jgi:hypothetical protein
MRRVLNRAWHLIRRSRFEADLAEEMEFHRAMKEDELRAGGMTATEAAWARIRWGARSSPARTFTAARCKWWAWSRMRTLRHE